MTISQSEIMNHALSIIKEQAKTIRTLKVYFWVLGMMLVLTLVSGFVVLYAGKSLPVEIPVETQIVEPDFGSFYPEDYWGY